MLNLDDYRDEYGCIKLDELNLRDGYKAITGDAPKQWKILPDGRRILFKEPFRFEKPSYRLEEPWPVNYELYSSLFEQEVADFLGIPTAKYDLAKYKGRVGVITYDFLSSGETIISGATLLERAAQTNVKGLEKCYRSWVTDYNSLKNIYLAIISYLPDNVCAEKIYNELVSNFYILDFVLTEVDRHDENWGLIYNGENYSLTPRFDSDSVALAFRGEERVSKFLYDIEFYGFDACMNIHYSTEESGMIYDIPPKPINEDFENFCGENLELVKNSFQLISKIDVNQIFKNIEKRIKSNIPEEYKRWVGLVTNHQIGLMKKIIEMTEDLNKDVSRGAI